jgi:hypothetical protein
MESEERRERSTSRSNRLSYGNRREEREEHHSNQLSYRDKGEKREGTRDGKERPGMRNEPRQG